MGIERFFSSLSREYRAGTIIKEITIRSSKINNDYIFFDFNSFVYGAKEVVLKKANKILNLLIQKKKNADFSEQSNLDSIATELNCSDFIASIDLTENEEIILKKINEFFEVGRLDHYIITQVLDNVFTMLTNTFDNTKIKRIMIALDGTPSKSKMVEQKKRRYMGSFTSSYKKELIEDKKDYLESIDSYLTTKYQISWDTKRISPGTTFMNLLAIVLNSEEFIGKISSILPALEIPPLISDVYDPGEGEMKIIDYILEKKEELNGTICMYSPDSDVILLGLILQNKLLDTTNKVFVLRHDQNKSKETPFYQYVDMIELSKKMFIDIKSKLPEDFELSSSAIINDIVLLFTVFGNDFLPKINSYDVRDDIKRIFSIYPEIINDNIQKSISPPYIIQPTDRKLKIQITAFSNAMEILGKHENEGLNVIYLDKKYANIDRIYKILVNYRMESPANIYKTIEKYYFFRTSDALHSLISRTISDFKQTDEDQDLNKFLEYFKASSQFLPTIHKINEGTPTMFYLNFKENFLELIDMTEIIRLITSNPDMSDIIGFIPYDAERNEEFFSQFDNVELLLKLIAGIIYISESNIKYVYYISSNGRLNHFLDFRNKATYGLTPITHTIQDDKYKYKMEKHEIKPEDVYKFEFFEMENMIDNYYTKMNARDDVELGEISNIEESKERYYRTNFDMEYNETNRMKIANDYLLGINWVFEYYFNGNSNFLYWYYPHEKSPLIEDINLLLVHKREHENPKFLSLFEDYLTALSVFIPREPFFTPLEQLFYVCPFDANNPSSQAFELIQGFISPKIIELLKVFITTKFENIDMNDVYFSVENVAKQVLDEPGPILEIDCKGVLYQNKCLLTQMIKYLSMGYEEYLANFRKLVPLEVQQELIPHMNIINPMSASQISASQMKYLAILGNNTFPANKNLFKKRYKVNY
ncbi:XRN 5'-3' exonuclease N-terminus [seawater metagenome]|uniref:XRN 5'-3' exonuclease N-terminus n=1 Tax=seawater metagenome TaxID=1561972 RepID=A0A5E8CKC7_9ZZZZ